VACMGGSVESGANLHNFPSFVTIRQNHHFRAVQAFTTAMNTPTLSATVSPSRTPLEAPPTVSQVADVRTLQEIDDEIATARATLDDVQRRLRSDPELDAARHQFAAAAAELQEAQRHQRQLDGEVARLNARIQPEEKRLYDGSVRNPKELGNI